MTGRTAMDWLYVYYRLPQGRLDDVLAESAALFAALRQQAPAVNPALLRRPELRDGDITFMEVYGPLPAGSLPGLQACLDALLPAYPLLQSAARHAEKFTELPCA